MSSALWGFRWVGESKPFSAQLGVAGREAVDASVAGGVAGRDESDVDWGEGRVRDRGRG